MIGLKLANTCFFCWRVKLANNKVKGCNILSFLLNTAKETVSKLCLKRYLLLLLTQSAFEDALNRIERAPQ